MSWIYNIIGVVFIGVIFDIILPVSKINKFMKCIYSVFILYSLVVPIIMFAKNVNLETGFESGNIEVGLEFVQQLNQSKNSTYSNLIETAIENEGILNVDVEISSNLDNSVYEVIGIEVNLVNSVLIDNSANINKYEVITRQIMKYLNIKEDMVKFYE